MVISILKINDFTIYNVSVIL